MIGINVEADGLIDPTVIVTDDGWVLEIKAKLQQNLIAVSSLYKRHRDKLTHVVLSTDQETTDMMKKADVSRQSLLYRKLADMESIQDLKNDYGANHDTKVLCIELENQVEQKIHCCEVHGDDNGRVLCIDLRVVSESYVGETVARGSPAK